MSETFPKLNAKEIIRILERSGFIFSRQMEVMQFLFIKMDEEQLCQSMGKKYLELDYFDKL